MNLKIKVLLICIIIISSFSCNSEDDNLEPDQSINYPEEELFESHIRLIKIELENKEHKFTNSGLHYIIQKEGTGEHVLENSKVNVRYLMVNLFNDEIIKESQFSGSIFDLKDEELMPGFKEALMFFKKGTRARIYLPYRIQKVNIGSTITEPDVSFIFDSQMIYLRSYPVISFDVEILEILQE